MLRNGIFNVILLIVTVAFIQASVALAGPPIAAAPPVGTTVIVFTEVCGGCVKKINTRLEKYPGIAKSECDINTKSVRITPQPRTVLSPKQLWEAMDEIGKPPVKLTGPGGTFTATPKQ